MTPISVQLEVSQAYLGPMTHPLPDRQVYLGAMSHTDKCTLPPDESPARMPCVPWSDESHTQVFIGPNIAKVVVEQ